MPPKTLCQKLQFQPLHFSVPCFSVVLFFVILLLFNDHFCCIRLSSFVKRFFFCVNNLFILLQFCCICLSRPDGSTEFQAQAKFLIAFKCLYLHGSQRPEANIKQQNLPPELDNNYLSLYFASGHSCDVEFHDDMEAHHNWYQCKQLFDATFSKQPNTRFLQQRQTHQ